MTLTEFLLARIAEDEADARVELERFIRDHGPAELVDTTWAHPYMDPRRVLARCEADRRIVEDWKSLADRIDDQGRPLHLFDPVTSMLLKATEPWIRFLALPYADHPEYRPEWKP